MRIFAYKNNHQVLKQSSSGGAFTRIVTQAVRELDGEYAIYGAAWDENLAVKHIRVDNIKDIVKFNGSKYSRSDLNGVYAMVEKDIATGRYVIFSGTPCQISGLSHFLQRKNIACDRILLIDIICHGTPKSVVWKDCKEWMEARYKHRIVQVSFRDKNVGWKRYPTCIVLDDHRTIRWTYFTQIYIRMFFSLLILEKGCFSCPFSNMNRVSDITLGDFWGVESLMPEFDKTGGVSLILANTKKGEVLCDAIQAASDESEKIKAYHGDLSAIKKFQHNLRMPTEMPENYDAFWDDYGKMSFAEIVKKYRFLTWKGRLKFYIKSMLIRLQIFDEKLS